jgi:heme/copper-type cytochrome/quinol oxidase subunit 2
MKKTTHDSNESLTSRGQSNSQKIFQKLSAFVLASALIITPTLLFAEAGYFNNPIDADTLDGFLLQLLDVVILIGAIVVVFFLILAGFKYVTARGDEKQITSAHQTLTWTIVGAAIVLGARVIASAIEATVNELGI